ncbi:VRR-NUC domain-containing protein [uncultured Gemella sp.]|jgi:Holliday junction resolvase|uniref:VRR-NUC domain-containing protein n=1 Tax=uncultured Gemella sp. TaxID=254352 RepID=UPI0028D77A5E|nr:VRR-NUC domain-containing protein [uncultured Gemella sp.]
MMSEKAFENKIKKFLKEKGCYFLKYNPEYFGIKGTPDLLICCNGYFLGIEVKRETGKPSKLQLKKIEEIKNAGGIAMVLYPSGFEKFKELIEELCNE